MPANRRRHVNSLPALKLFIGFAVVALLVATGLGYVYCQNQLHRASDETGKLEKELRHLRMLCDGASVNIAKLSSHQALQQKWDSGYFKPAFVRIPDDRINRVSAVLKTTADNAEELLPATNKRTAP